MDKLNKLRMLAGISVKHSPSAPKPLMEARAVPQRRADLAPQTEENMKARVENMNAAAMHVAKAIAALEKIPATDFMGDVPHYAAELNSLLDGEGGSTGMKHMVSSFQTEYRSWKRKANAEKRAEEEERLMKSGVTEQFELTDDVPEDDREYAERSADLDAMAYGDEKSPTSPEVAAKIDALAQEAGAEEDGDVVDDVDSDETNLQAFDRDMSDTAPLSDEYGEEDDFEDEVDAIDSELDGDEPDDSMDGDFDSAMASAGHGTDEDYGAFGESVDEIKFDGNEDKDESPAQLHNVKPSPGDHDAKVRVPNSVKQALRDEAKQAREEAKRLGVSDKDAFWFYENLAKAFEELLGHLEAGTVYDIKKAQIFMTSLMGPMLHKIPAEVVNFVAKGGQELTLKDYMKPVDKKYPVTGKMYKGE